MFKCSLLLPNRLTHAVKLGKAFLLFANKFIEILQRADASFLHEELYLRSEFQVIDTGVCFAVLLQSARSALRSSGHLDVLHH